MKTFLAISLFFSAEVIAADLKPKPVPVPVKPKAVAVVKYTIYNRARSLAMKQDFLGLRVWVRKAYPLRITHAEWYSVKNLIQENAAKTGYDLIPFWNLRNAKGKSAIDQQLEKADALMLGQQFEAAFVEYQNTAKEISKISRTRFDARRMLQVVYHAMGRALYGAGRYNDALTVYQWITPNYPFFRQALFEKMWASFKAGRVDLALGAIASQRSRYFSKYLSPEAYLIQAYIYKKLCRDNDLKEVMDEMKLYESTLTRGGLKEWALIDPLTATLFNLGSAPTKTSEDLVAATAKERENEKKEILDRLNSIYQKQKPMVLNALKTALAYGQLAVVTDTKSVLKPVKALESRDELLKQDLEVWPADSTEEWADELGKHVFIGESYCNKKN